MTKPISNLNELLIQARALQSDQKLQALLDPSYRSGPVSKNRNDVVRVPRRGG